jgi:hypothetical protein
MVLIPEILKKLQFFSILIPDAKEKYRVLLGNAWKKSH